MKHLRFLRGLGRHVDLMNRGRQPLYVDYPVEPLPRYGWGSPRHAALDALLGARRDRYREILRGLEGASEHLQGIPLTGTDREPSWLNRYIGGLDAATLYCAPKLFGSKRYLEVGSGSSTRFVRRGAEDFGLPIRITSIDPSPRAEVDDICDDLVRARLEEAPLELFDALEPNDVVMFDGSHRCFQNSDVAVAFLDVLPRLAPGVLVFMHDIFLPDDYPESLMARYYSEQYLLAVLLLADGERRYEIVFPAHFCETDAELGPETLRTWRGIAPADLETHASGFWLRVKST
ncbi:MAG: class I SAM-dependent methyltransferase [Gemmatimonadales bacterium]